MSELRTRNVEAADWVAPPAVAPASVAAPPAAPPPQVPPLRDPYLIEAEVALFDLQHPSSQARLELQEGQRLLRRHRNMVLRLPANSLLVLPEVQCAPTYRTALRLQVHSDHAGHLEILAASEAVTAQGTATLHGVGCTLRSIDLHPGHTTTNLQLPDLEDLRPQPSDVAPGATRLVVRFVPAAGTPALAACHVDGLELRGLSPAGA